MAQTVRRGAGVPRLLALGATGAVALLSIILLSAEIVPVTEAEARLWWWVASDLGLWFGSAGWLYRVPLALSTLAAVACGVWLGEWIGKPGAGAATALLMLAGLAPVIVLGPMPGDLFPVIVVLALAEVHALSRLPKRQVRTGRAHWLRLGVCLGVLGLWASGGAGVVAAAVGALARCRRDVIRGMDSVSVGAMGVAGTIAVVGLASGPAEGQPHSFGGVALLALLPLGVIALVFGRETSGPTIWVRDASLGAALIALLFVLAGLPLRDAVTPLIVPLALLGGISVARRKSAVSAAYVALACGAVLTVGLVGLTLVYRSYAPGLPAAADPYANARAMPLICERVLTVMEEVGTDRLITEEETTAAHCALEGGLDPSLLYVVARRPAVLPPGRYVMILRDPFGTRDGTGVLDSYRIAEEGRVDPHLDRSYGYRILAGSVE
ncbi:MAG: hypothetical protein AAGK98_11445 [Pseudomonadota bacterium]